MSWDDEAPTWDANPAVRAYAMAAMRSLEQTLSGRGATLDGARVLDFGCGTGLLSEQMARAGARVIGVDPAAAMVAVLAAKAVPGIRAVASTLDEAITQGVLQAGSLDLVTCSSVCGFLDDYPGTVATLVGLLRPGGLFVQWDWERDPGAAEPMGLNREAIEAALAASPLVDVVVDVGFEAAFEDMTMAPLRGVGRAAYG